MALQQRNAQLHWEWLGASSLGACRAVVGLADPRRPRYASGLPSLFLYAREGLYPCHRNLCCSGNDCQ